MVKFKHFCTKTTQDNFEWKKVIFGQNSGSTATLNNQVGHNKLTSAEY